MASKSRPTLLEARNITRRSRDGKTLLDDVSLRVAAGERWAISGPTGSGKTLLLRVLVLLDPLDSGEVLWNGRPVLPHDIPTFRRNVIYLQQQPTLIEGTVEDNLRLPFQFKVNQDREFHRDRCLRLLSELNLGESFLAKKSSDLSGGESQITALLRAVQLNPSVLLLDEPTAALDAASVQLIEKLVHRWFRESEEERAVVWVTHDEPQRERVAKRHVSLQNGRLAE